MEDILESIGDAIHEFFVDVCGGMFLGIFDDANAATGDIARQVGLTPSQWNGSIFNMIQNLSNNVVVPIAGMIITFVLCYELITTITEKTICTMLTHSFSSSLSNQAWYITVWTSDIIIYSPSKLNALTLRKARINTKFLLFFIAWHSFLCNSQISLPHIPKMECQDKHS
jgi:hypothetical protein